MPGRRKHRTQNIAQARPFTFWRFFAQSKIGRFLPLIMMIVLARTLFAPYPELAQHSLYVSYLLLVILTSKIVFHDYRRWRYPIVKAIDSILVIGFFLLASIALLLAMAQNLWGYISILASQFHISW